MMRRSLLLLMMSVLFFSSVFVSAQDDVAQSNIELLQSVIDEVNSGNFQAFTDLYAQQFMMNQGDDVLAESTSDDVAGFIAGLTSGIPDLQIGSHTIFAQGDWVAAELTFSGNFTEVMNFFGGEVEPTGEAVSWSELDLMHIVDGQIVEQWTVSEPAVPALLGIAPPMEENTEGALELPTGYQTLSDEERAGTYISGMEERNTALFQEIVDAGVTTDGFAANGSSYYADTYVSWQGGIPYAVITAESAEGDAAFWGTLASAMPDITLESSVTVAQGDWVAALVRVRGTFTEDVDLMGTPLTATGEEISWLIGVISRFDADGKIVEEFVETDPTAMLAGLGLMPPMGDE